MSKVFKVLLPVLALCYPFLIFILLNKYNASPRILVLAMIFMGIVYFLSHKKDRTEKGIKKLQFWLMIIIVSALSILTLITENAGFVKLYPVSVNLMLFTLFFSTLISPPSIIFQFATLQDKTIVGSEDEEYVKSYCRRVTIVWVIFFIINGSISLISAFTFSNWAWTLYNGLLSYIFMGAIFVGEFIVRKIRIK